MLLTMPDQHSLPDDKDALRAMVVALQAQSDSLQSENLSYEKALQIERCLLYTSPSPRDQRGSRMPSSA